MHANVGQTPLGIRDKIFKVRKKEEECEQKL